MKSFTWGTAVLLFSSLEAARGQNLLIEEGAPWRFFRGSTEPPASWRDVGFDDSSWEVGETPIGYGPDLPFQTRLEDMENGYVTFYCRKSFDPGEATSFGALLFALKYDDGLIVSLNGRELFRRSMPDGRVENDSPGLDHEVNQNFELKSLECDLEEVLRPGENVVAVEVHNASTVSSDAAFSLALGYPDLCPRDLSCEYRESIKSVVLRWQSSVPSLIYDSLRIERNGVPLERRPPPGALLLTDRDPPPGRTVYRLRTRHCGLECPDAVDLSCEVRIGGPPGMFLRGDIDQDGGTGINDGVFLLNWLFREPNELACPDAADADDNGVVDLSDALVILRYLFQGGQPPALPLGNCGFDPTVDGLPPCGHAACP